MLIMERTMKYQRTKSIQVNVSAPNAERLERFCASAPGHSAEELANLILDHYLTCLEEALSNGQDGWILLPNGRKFYITRELFDQFALHRLREGVNSSQCMANALFFSL